MNTLTHSQANNYALEARLSYWVTLWIDDIISDDVFFEQLNRITKLAETPEIAISFYIYFDIISGERIISGKKN